MPLIEIDKFEGMNARIAKEKLPVVLFPKVINLEMTQVEGYARTRKGYKNIITTGLTALSNMSEFVDKNGTREIVLLDGSTLKRIPYSAGYGAVTTIANDERTSGATMNTFKPVNKYSEIRSGAGVNAATDYPVWYGYIKERNRFADNETITAGKYLTDQDYRDVLTSFFGSTYPVLSVLASYKSSGGLTEKKTYTVLFSPVIDGQRGFPVLKRTINLSDISASRFAIGISFVVATADVEKFKRLTAIDIFVAEGVFEFDNRNENNSPAYFLERVDLNEESVNWLRIDGTLDNTPASEKITIASFADWQSQRLLNIFVKDVSNDQIYQVTNYTENSTNIELTTSPVAQDSGSAEFIFYSDWYDNGSGYEYRTFYDNDYKKLGSEMYDYLGIPTGDEGISDFRYKYGVIAGRRFFAVGFPDRQYGHYSVPYNYDVIPARNRFPVKRDATGIVDLADESVLIFYKDRAERVTVYDNTQYRIDEDFLNIGCTNYDSITKVSDGVIALMDYKAPVLLVNGVPVPGFADALRDWWDNKLSDAVKEGCISGYNRLSDQIWFSFPGYSDSEFSNGIVFVFDMTAWNDRKLSAWFILDSDKTINAVTVADDLHLLTSNGTQLQDWNNASQDENVQGRLLLRLLNNRRFTQKINIERIEADFYDSGSNSLSIKMYLDESGTATATLTITASNREALLEYVADSVEFEVLTASGTQQTDLMSLLIGYSEMRGI